MHLFSSRRLIKIGKNIIPHKLTFHWTTLRKQHFIKFVIHDCRRFLPGSTAFLCLYRACFIKNKFPTIFDPKVSLLCCSNLSTISNPLWYASSVTITPSSNYSSSLELLSAPKTCSTNSLVVGGYSIAKCCTFLVFNLHTPLSSWYSRSIPETNLVWHVSHATVV